MTHFLVYGTFVRGESNHDYLVGATLLGEVLTAARYRLFSVNEGWPALIPRDDGVEIGAELYDIPEELLATLARIEPPGWERNPVELADGRVVEAFLGDPELVQRGIDISRYGSWAAFVRAQA